MPDRVSFPYERALTPIGFVWVPTARVQIGHRRNRLDLDMIVDTGADLSMIPYQIGFALGLRKGSVGSATLAGIAGSTPYLLKSVSLRIGPFRFPCRVAWAQTDEVPLLLGRTDVLDRLTATFDRRRRCVTFRD
jgi:hypothetical protein